MAAYFKSEAAQVCIVSLRVASGLDYQGLLLMSANFPLQRLRNSFCDLALYGKNVSQTSIIGFGPKLETGSRLN
jgi:hypothetical protein